MIFTGKYERVFKFKYMLQLLGISMMLYYYSKEMRICINPKNESTFMKLAVLLSHTFLNLICQNIIPKELARHRANFKLELLIYNAVMFQYLLTYPNCYSNLLFILHNLLLAVSLAFLVLSLL